MKDNIKNIKKSKSYLYYTARKLDRYISSVKHGIDTKEKIFLSYIKN